MILITAEDLAASEYNAKKDDWLDAIRPRFTKRLEPLSLIQLGKDRWPEKAIKEVLDRIIEEIIEDAKSKAQPSPIQMPTIDRDFQRAVYRAGGLDIDGPFKHRR